MKLKESWDELTGSSINNPPPETIDEINEWKGRQPFNPTPFNFTIKENFNCLLN